MAEIVLTDATDAASLQHAPRYGCNSAQHVLCPPTPASEQIETHRDVLPLQPAVSVALAQLGDVAAGVYVQQLTLVVHNWQRRHLMQEQGGAATAAGT